LTRSAGLVLLVWFDCPPVDSCLDLLSFFPARALGVRQSSRRRERTMEGTPMKRGLISIFSLMVLACAALASIDSARARLPYKKEWEKRYVKKDSALPAEKALTVAVETAKCNVCHMGESKKEHNTYGTELKKFLTKNDQKNKEKIQKAFEEVEKMRSPEGGAGSPTFGELIKQGKLPGGEAK
jgi:hypothetical protein